MGLFRRKNSESGVAAIGGDGTFSFDGVVGESHYRSALSALIEAASEEDRQRGRVEVQAVLLPEPTNKFDPKAIAVVVGSSIVGYIAREYTDDFHDAIGEVRKMGYASAGFNAVVVWNPRIADSPIGVLLDALLDDSESE